VFNLLSDTCVWFDMAKEPQQQLLLSVLEELIKLQEVKILLPRVVVHEFQRNRQRIIDDSRKSLSSVFKRVKEAVAKYGDTASKDDVMDQLNDIDQRLPTLGDAVGNSLSRIEAIFRTAEIIETSEAVKVRVFERGLQIKAPFNGKKNSTGDAILIEIYADCVQSPQSIGQRFAFVTHNVNDFSDIKVNNKAPHPDIASCFSKRKSLYFTNIGDALRKVRPDLVSELMAELGQWEPPLRSLSEILAAERELFDKVWYDRHQGLRHGVESGEIRVVDKETFPTPTGEKRPVQKDILKGAMAAARKVEKTYGIENLGPWTDFEWGMINGKLSALRWMMGDDWDMLDT
jgi:PIN domain